MTAESKATAAPTLVTLTYAGRRLNGDKLMQTFAINGDYAEQNMVLFSGIQWVTLGATYEATRTAEGSLRIKVRPARVDVQLDVPEETTCAWAASDEIATSMHRRRLTAQRLAKKPEQLDDVVRALRPLVAHLRYADTRMFIEALVDRAQQEARQHELRQKKGGK